MALSEVGRLLRLANIIFGAWLMPAPLLLAGYPGLGAAAKPHSGRIADSARAAGWPDQEPLWRVGSLEFYRSSTAQLIRSSRYRAGYRNLKKTERLSISCLQRVGRNDGLEQ